MNTTYVKCPAPGVMLAGAHVTHIPAHLTASALTTYAAMRDAGIMCPTCGGNGQVPYVRTGFEAGAL